VTNLVVSTKDGEVYLIVFKGSEKIVHFALDENQSRQLAEAFAVAADDIAASAGGGIVPADDITKKIEN